MLRNRSRAVTSKQAIMSDGHTSLPSPTQNHKKPTSSFLGSPRFFGEFLAKGLFESEAVMTPTSILDNKKYSILGNNPFALDKNLSKPPNMNFSENKNYPNEILESEGVGLAFIDSLNNEKHDDDRSKNNNSRMVLLGSKLKIQIPPLPPSAVSTTEKSPKSPADFGIKTPNSHKLAASLSCALKSGNPSTQMKESPQGSTVVSCNLSLSEMELSEEYTCVISHGPNPRTTHIYDNCIVESCCGVVGLSKLRKQYGFPPDNNQNSMSVNFLSSCYRCKKKLGEGKDIYMYRGEKAFCSHECRCEEMLLDGMENPEPDSRSTNCI